MRKPFCLMILAVLLLFSGCANRMEVTPESTATPEPAPTAAPVEDGIPVVTPAPTAEPRPADILDGRQPMDEKGVLSRISNPTVESAVQQEVALYEGGLLLYGPVAAEGGPGYRLALLSFADGAVIKETVLTGLELPEVRIRDERDLDVSDYSDGELRSFYGDFACLTEVSEHAPCGMYRSADGQKLYSVAQTGIYAAGDPTPLLDNVANLYVGKTTGSCVSIRYTDLATQLDRQAVLDLAGGSVKPLPFEGVYFTAECADGLWLADREDGWYLGRGSRPSRFTLAEPYSNVTLLADPVRLLVSTWDAQGAETMTLYSAEGRFLSRCTLPAGSGRFGEPAWSEAHGGYFFTVIDPESADDRLLFWDLSVPVSGADLTLTAAYVPPTGGSVSQSLYDRAGAIGSAAGVSVQIAEQVETEYGAYTVAQELDETAIAAGLDALENALNAYPAGFMPQLHYGSCQAIEFRLAGAITRKNQPESVSGFSSFSAFVESQTGKTVVVLDVNNPGSLEQTLCHEIAHLIDDKLSFDASLRPGSPYREETWAALNPAGFAYAETYDEMPMQYFNDGYEAYFLDIYSRTFAREDRARILEYATAGVDYVFSTPERQAKLAYLCRCIRDGFDTSGWPDQTPWEAALNRCQ